MKRLLALLVALMVVALALPTMASAEVELHKYDEMITLTIAYPMDLNADGIVAMEKAGEPYTDNRWVQYFRDECNINCEYEIIGTEPDYQQKLLLAADDLPDIFWTADLAFHKQLVEAEAIADIRPYYEELAGECLIDTMEYEGKNIWQPVMYGDGYYGMPVKMPSTNGYNHLWLRQDWLDALGLEVPTTMDEVMEVARAFKEKDPDGDGADDTIGLMISNEYLAESKGIFWAFGGKTAVRKFWDLQEDGTVAFSEVQDEMKGGLAWLRDMYQQGLLNQEFATQDITKAFEYVASNQCGIFFAPHWYAFRMQSARSGGLDETAEWIIAPLPTGNGEEVKIYASNCFDAIECVSSSCEYPEALVILMNAYAEKLFGEENDFSNFFSCPENDSVWSASPVHLLHSLVDLTPHRELKAAMTAVVPEELQNASCNEKNAWAKEYGAPEGLSGVGLDYYNYIYRDDQLSYHWMFGWQNSCFNRVDDTYPDIIEWNGYIGAPTETWGDRWSSMKELIDTSYLEIIQGTEDIDTAFARMVEEWYAIGGEAVTAEVNEIVASYN